MNLGREFVRKHDRSDRLCVNRFANIPDCQSRWHDSQGSELLNKCCVYWDRREFGTVELGRTGFDLNDGGELVRMSRKMEMKEKAGGAT